MIWILVGAALLAALLLFARWYVNAEPRDVFSALRYIGLFFAIVVLGIAIVSGRFGILWLILLSVLPWLGRLRAFNRQVGKLKGPASGQHIDKRAKFVVLYVNPETGDMDGRVLAGPKAGMLLSDLGIDALVTLYEAAVIEDDESAKIIEDYLDRMHSQAWRSKSKIVNGGSDGAEENKEGDGGMTRSDAYEILGLQPGASKTEIEFASQALIETGHPDASEAENIRRKVIQAKGILLGE